MQGLMTLTKCIHELGARIRLASPPPDIVCVTETHLSKTTEELQLEGYAVVSRSDRGGEAERGGMLVFAAEKISERVVELEISKDAERVWVVLHTSYGPYLLGTWYRPGCGPIKAKLEASQHSKKKYQGSGAKQLELYAAET